MKKIKILMLTLLTCLILSAPVYAAELPPQATPIPTETPAPTPTPAPILKDGWNKLENGKKQYIRKGVPVTGIQKISGKVYCFDQDGFLVTNNWYINGSKKYRTDKNGVMLKSRLITVNKKVYYLSSNGTVFKGWKKFSNGRSYFDANGVRVTGLKKIGKYTYYFNGKGIMQTGTVKVKNNTYYLKDNGQLEARKTGSRYYNASGKAMSKVQADDFETLQRAKSIVKKITTSKMSKKEKLKKCFDWVMAKPYVTRRSFTNEKGWPAVYANDHFVMGGGNCFSDAAAFAYLAKALGYTKVYVCTDSAGRDAHGWAEINGLVYDPLFAQSKSYSRNYGVKYGVYILQPILRIAI